HLMREQIVNLADVTDRILTSRGFGAHRAVQADQAIDAISAANLPSVRAIRRCPQYCQVHPPLASRRIVERVDRHFQIVERLQAGSQAPLQIISNGCFAIEVSTSIGYELVHEGRSDRQRQDSILAES